MGSQQAGYENALHDFMAWVAERHDVYGLGETPLAVYQAWSARVVAETIIAGSMPSWRESREVTLGERGPVLFWFSEGNENKALPFAVVYTEAGAWVGI